MAKAAADLMTEFVEAGKSFSHLYHTDGCPVVKNAFDDVVITMLLCYFSRIFLRNFIGELGYRVSVFRGDVVVVIIKVIVIVVVVVGTVVIVVEEYSERIFEVPVIRTWSCG